MTASTRRSDWRLLAVCSALWLALILGAGWVLSQAHTLLLELSPELRANPWVARAIRQTSLAFLGVIWLIFIFWLEHYLRTGVQQSTFSRRVVRAAGGVIGGFLIVSILRLL
ncbi:hypothetical protein [Roseiflexus castenholzii]|uniref:hypothetical protein n=1 Tax=Roseiflexus castenholzii TaxID=120962 RepID=UPI0023556173